MLQLIVLASERCKTAAAHVRELREDALGVVGVNRQLDAFPEPSDGKLMVADLAVGQAGGLVEPDVIRVLRLQLRPDLGRPIGATGAEVKLGDVRAAVGSPAPAVFDRALHRRDGVVVASSMIARARKVRIALGHVEAARLGQLRELVEDGRRPVEVVVLQHLLESHDG